MSLTPERVNCPNCGGLLRTEDHQTICLVNAATEITRLRALLAEQRDALLGQFEVLIEASASNVAAEGNGPDAGREFRNYVMVADLRAVIETVRGEG